jgi:hypothetical protein
MTTRRIWTIGTTFAVTAAVAIALTKPASTQPQYEVWAIDQSDSPGKTTEALCTSGTGTSSKSGEACSSPTAGTTTPSVASSTG